MSKDDEYIEWFEKQPERFVHRVWTEGYAEGIMQERNGIVDLEVELPPVPSGESLIKDIEKRMKEESQDE